MNRTSGNVGCGHAFDKQIWWIGVHMWWRQTITSRSVCTRGVTSFACEWYAPHWVRDNTVLPEWFKSICDTHRIVISFIASPALSFLCFIHVRIMSRCRKLLWNTNCVDNGIASVEDLPDSPTAVATPRSHWLFRFIYCCRCSQGGARWSFQTRIGIESNILLFLCSYLRFWFCGRHNSIQLSSLFFSPAIRIGTTSHCSRVPSWVLFTFL